MVSECLAGNERGQAAAGGRRGQGRASFLKTRGDLIQRERAGENGRSTREDREMRRDPRNKRGAGRGRGLRREWQCAVCERKALLGRGVGAKGQLACGAISSESISSTQWNGAPRRDAQISSGL